MTGGGIQHPHPYIYIPPTFTNFKSCYLITIESCVSMMVVTIDLDEESNPLNSSICCFILFPLIILCHALQTLMQS